MKPIHFVVVAIVALSLGAFAAFFMAKWITDPRPGHTMTKTVDCSRHLYILSRQGDMVTFRDEETKEVRTVTIEEFYKL